MKRMIFPIKKWGVRAFVAIGAIFGLSSCGGVFSTPKVYGPPPSPNNDIEVVEDVYGPPVGDLDTISPSDSIIKKELQNEEQQ
jgi:hypothetical protein